MKSSTQGENQGTTPNPPKDRFTAQSVQVMGAVFEDLELLRRYDAAPTPEAKVKFADSITLEQVPVLARGLGKRTFERREAQGIKS